MVSLRTQLRRVRRRLLNIGLSAAAVWGLAAATIFILLGAWLDLLWEFSPQWRIATLWAAGACGAALLAAAAAMTVRGAADAAVARALDRVGQRGGRILTGWELALGRYGLRGVAPAPLSAALAGLAVADAAASAAAVPRAKVAPVRPLGRSLAALGLVWAAVAVAAVSLPGLTSTQWNRFLRPWADIPPFSLSSFKIEPGNVKVPYGSELEIRATVSGARWNNWNWSSNRPTAASRRCRCSPRRTGFGGRCWPRWSSRPTISSAPIVPAAPGSASTL